LDIQDVAEEGQAAPVWDDSIARLPLTAAMAQRFEAIIQTYEHLAEMVLNTLRLEIRCRVMCNLAASLTKGDFRLESEALEPDPDIADLAGHLTQCDRLAQQALSSFDAKWVTAYE
jgi:exocyst complex component 4